MRLNKIVLLCVCLLFFGSPHSQETFQFTGAYQSYIVPSGVTGIKIECWGAAGGNGNLSSSPGGFGAFVSGEFQVQPGEELIIIVGEKGEDGNDDLDGGGGGGGSFVIQKKGMNPMIIAAGGGGGSYQEDCPGEGGRIIEKAGNGGYPAPTVGEGGYGDNEKGGGCGCGGGGWNSDGLSNRWCTGGIMKGGTGGTSQHVVGVGGFGGGGGTYHGGGGGGGYSGGNGGIYTVGGGGGGSFNKGNKPEGKPNIQKGDGKIIITILCNPLEVKIPTTNINPGQSVVLYATSSNMGVINWNNGVMNGKVFTPPNGNTVYTAISSHPDDCQFSIELNVGTTSVQFENLCEEFLFITLEDLEDQPEASASVPKTVIVSRNEGSTGITASEIGRSLTKEKIAKALKLNPNPFRGEIELILDGNFEYTLFTEDGKIIESGSATNKHLLRMYKLKAGDYYLQIKSKKLHITTKITKK